MEHYTTSELLQSALEVALARSVRPLVLAVSGGSDSMAMMFAMARWSRGRIAAVATFDHGTGAYASEAAALVAAHARRLGLTVVRERARVAGFSEADWRAMRWDFLNRVARGFDATVATAHTLDDQVETVVMRLLRGSGARGLAALAAPGEVVRPWLGVERAELRQWVESEQVPFLDDPMNISPKFSRVRIRHELLPVLEAASPGFRESMISIADRSARLRRDVDAYLDEAGLRVSSDETVFGRSASIPVEVLERTTDEGRALLWQAIFGRIGVALDAAGTRASVRFTSTQRTGAYITLGGGASLERVREAGRLEFVVRSPLARPEWDGWSGSWGELPDRIGPWIFRRTNEPSEEDDLWQFRLPALAQVAIRPWRAGDRIMGPGAQAPRRVTRYFTESRIPVPDRLVWPVVTTENELVWVPGVCRADAVPPRSGRPAQIWYRCERKFD